jgi:hypothetical protein
VRWKQLNLHIYNRTREQHYLLPLVDNVIAILGYAASNGRAISEYGRKWQSHLPANTVSLGRDLNHGRPAYKQKLRGLSPRATAACWQPISI